MVRVDDACAHRGASEVLLSGHAEPSPERQHPVLVRQQQSVCVSHRDLPHQTSDNHNNPRASNQLSDHQCDQTPNQRVDHDASDTFFIGVSSGNSVMSAALASWGDT